MDAVLHTLAFTPLALVQSNREPFGLGILAKVLQITFISVTTSSSGIWRLRCRQVFFYGIVFSLVLLKINLVEL